MRDQYATAPERLLTQLPDRLPMTVDEAKLVTEGVSRALRRAARTARQPAPLISGGGGFKARRGDRPFRIGIFVSFLLLFCAPTLGETLYWGLIASPQYATEIKFAIRSGQASPLDALGGLLSLGGSQQAQDTQIVADYVSSGAMARALDAKLALRHMYSNPHADYFSRFDASKPIEDLEKYWHNRVTVKVDTASGIVTVIVRAFTASDSLAIGTEILSLSEKLVNDLSGRSRRDALVESKAELDRAETQLQAATSAMRHARNQQGIIDAKATAEMMDRVSSALQLEKARLEQDLAGLPGGGQDQTSPTARVLRARIASVDKQIVTLNAQIAGSKAGMNGTLADRLGPLSVRQTELDFARQQYSQAAAIYQNARVKLETQEAYLVTSLRPTLAQEATYPRRWWEWSIVVIPSLFLWMITAAVAFLIRDNMAK